MLIAGELAVRWVAEIEATASATKSNFKFSSRTQVSSACPALAYSWLDLLHHQLLLTALSMLNTAASVRSLQARLGLPLPSQVAGWTIFGVCPTHCSLHSLVPRSDKTTRVGPQRSPRFSHSLLRRRGRPRGAC